MTTPDMVRRPGYAPTTATLGRRGRHTRDRIVACAGELFVAHGYHGTSIDMISKAVGGSRATVYQYFERKDDIFLELVGQCQPVVLEHGRRLGRLGPHAEGLHSLNQWLLEWAQIYDKYAMVFLEFPGIGTIEGLPESGADAVSDRYAETIADKLRDAGVQGIDATDGAAALLRISHMVNLYRFRGMFGLRSGARTTASLAIAIQRLLFPETPLGVLEGFAPPDDLDQPGALAPGHRGQPGRGQPEPPNPDPSMVSPIRQDVLSAASALFTERGFYSVSMEDIASAAEVSRATLYRHFSTRVKILEELTSWALLEADHLSTDLEALARRGGSKPGVDIDELHAWLGRYVRFHRSYSGVIRSWYDGTIAQQLPGDAVEQGMGAFNIAVAALLSSAELPAWLDLTVAAAVFLAVLGRMTELAMSQHPEERDYHAADLMLIVLRRTLFGHSVP
jgi:AcrR family transcriptional regulator